MAKEKQFLNVGVVDTIDYVAAFNRFKTELEEIDKKYSPDVLKVETEVPESLNLTKLTYEIPTEDELYTAAKTALEGSYLKSVGSINNDKLKQENSAQQQIENAQKTAQRNKETLITKLNDALSSIRENATERGLARSSIVESAVSDAKGDYNAEAVEIDESAQDKVDSLYKQLERLKEYTEQALEQLKQSNSAAVAAEVQSMLAKALSEQSDVEKYNNTLQEKEQKYLQSRAETENELYNDEVDRASEIAEMYTKIGKSGVEEMEMQEKLVAAKDFFSKLTKKTALELINSDSSMKQHFGEYYDYLVNYIQHMS